MTTAWSNVFASDLPLAFVFVCGCFPGDDFCSEIMFVLLRYSVKLWMFLFFCQPCCFVKAGFIGFWFVFYEKDLFVSGVLFSRNFRTSMRICITRCTHYKLEMKIQGLFNFKHHRVTVRASIKW